MQIFEYCFDHSNTYSSGWTIRDILAPLVIVGVVFFTLSCSRTDPNGEALLQAARVGDITLVRKLLAEGTNIDYQGEHLATALYTASIKGHLNIVQLLLANGAKEIETKTDNLNLNGYFPLIGASSNGHEEVVKALLANGENVDRQNTSMGLTALHMASSNGEVRVVKLLLEKGAKIDLQSKIGSTALMSAVASCQAQTVQILLDNGANHNHQDIESRTVQMWLTEGYCAPEDSLTDVLQVLLANGVNINYQNEYGVTVLHHASYKGDAKLVKALLANGANVEIRTKFGMTAFDLAKTEEIRKLLNGIKGDVANFFNH